MTDLFPYFKLTPGGGGHTPQTKEVEITENGQLVINADEGYDCLSSVTANVNVPSSGEGGGALKMMDFDGTILYSFTREEVMEMTELPDPPDHSDNEVPLTFDGWNWTLESIKEQLDEIGGEVLVGATYHPTDGLTHLIVEQSFDSPDTAEIIFSVYITKSPNVIDWGDGTTDTYTNNRQVSHIYYKAGRYDVTLGENLMYFTLGAESYGERSRFCRRAYLSGSSVDQGCFSKCALLDTVTIPETVTSIGLRSFGYCFSLENIILPKSITEINTSFLFNCYALKHVSLPSSVTTFNASFDSSYVMGNIALPRNIHGTYFSFRQCRNVDKIIIPKEVTTIGSYSLSDCGIKEFTIPDSVTSIEMKAFSECKHLRTVVISKNVLSIEQGAFSSCPSLQKVIIENGLTSIGDTAFVASQSLKIINIPSSVTSIGSNAFNNCYCTIKMESTTPPTIQTNTLNNNLKIIVPIGYAAVYKNATNWSKFADIIDDGYTADTVISASHEVVSDITGVFRSVTIKSTYVTGGYDIDGNRVNNITEVITLDYPISPNYSDQPSSQTLTIEYLDYTGTVTVVVPPMPQMAFTIESINGEYPCELSWLSSPTDGYIEFESTNQNKPSSCSSMKLTSKVSGDVSLYIRSNGEAAYDYTIISKTGLAPNDQTGSKVYENSNFQMANTKSNAKSGNALSDFTKVDYTGLNVGDVIIFTYRKDSSGDQGTDTGYILIPTM